MIIGTFNVQNKFYLKHYDGKNQQDNPNIFRQMLTDYNIDILGTQEFVKRYLNHLDKLLVPTYQIVGDFRFRRLFSDYFKFNETNSIISKCSILSYQTLSLPFLPTLTPRIMTKAYIHTSEFGTICFLNTHLSYANPKVQKKQLNVLREVLQKSEVPTVLTGDFNMSIYNPLLKQFIKDLKALHMVRVPIYENTFKKHKKKRAIDHIFIPDTWNIKSYQVVKDKKFDSFSDHYLVLVEVYRNV